jgi:ABC-type transport system involved in cytochrome bd biosynthesis fused ATPase/permease subunit
LWEEWTVLQAAQKNRNEKLPEKLRQNSTDDSQRLAVARLGLLDADWWDVR